MRGRRAERLQLYFPGSLAWCSADAFVTVQFFSRSFIVAVQRSLEMRVHCLPSGSRITTFDRLKDRRVFPK